MTAENIQFGNPSQIVDGVYLLRMPMPFRLNHINLYLIEDAHGWTIIDCGLNNDETKAVWEEVFSGFLADKPVVRIIVTHLHPDHIGLAEWLRKKTGAPVYMSELEHELAELVFNLPIDDPAHIISFYKNLGVEGARLDSLLVQSSNYRELVKTLPQEVEYLEDGDVLTIAGREWDIRIGKGHSPACVCLWSSDLAAMIVGDHILPSISPNIGLLSVGPDDPLGDYLSSLREFRSIPCQTYLPSHGFPETSYGERIDDLLSHHSTHLLNLESLLAEPHRVIDCVPHMFRSDLPDHQFYFAVGETASHLIYLESQGRLTRSGNDDVWLFSRK